MWDSRHFVLYSFIVTNQDLFNRSSSISSTWLFSAPSVRQIEE